MPTYEDMTQVTSKDETGYKSLIVMIIVQK